MNNVCLIGRITKDLELRTTESGKHVCKFTLAVKRDENSTDFINCIVWGNQAENLSKYQKKGNQISVVGAIRTGNYESNGKINYTFEVLANNIQYLESKKQATEEPKKEFEDNSLYLDEVVLDDSELPF